MVTRRTPAPSTPPCPPPPPRRRPQGHGSGPGDRSGEAGATPGRGGKRGETKALEREREALGRRAESLAQRQAYITAVREQLAGRNHAVREVEGALSGATESYDHAHHAFVTERDRAINLNRLIPHMRTVRETAQTTTIAENARLPPSRDPPLAFDRANQALRMVPVGRAVPAAPRTKPTTSDGAGRVAYNPARPGLQDGHPGPAAVPYPAAAAAVLPPAAPLLPPTTPTSSCGSGASSRRAGAPSCRSGASPCCSAAALRPAPALQAATATPAAPEA